MKANCCLNMFSLDCYYLNVIELLDTSLKLLIGHLVLQNKYCDNSTVNF